MDVEIKTDKEVLLSFNSFDPKAAEREAAIRAAIADKLFHAHQPRFTVLCPEGHPLHIDAASDVFEASTGHRYTAHCSEGEFFWSGE